jgi:aminoglycoside phosphotransferase family enzyme
MTIEHIHKLLLNGKFPEETGKRELIETHISWVILCDQFVYKIKKPVQYSFLDFSTLALRLHYCNREIELNKRLTNNVYLEVVPVHEWQRNIIIGGNKGTLIDYAVKMYKLDTEKQMDKLLIQHRVTESDIKKLAEKIALFHKKTTIIYQKDLLDIQKKFNDLEAEKEYLSKQLDGTFDLIINNTIEFSDKFLNKNKGLIARRLKEGFYRDCHGDLHSRNIFLLPEPVPFDCIEFNDDFRQIDVLNEVAFLCMDLDAFGHQDLSALFLKYYHEYFPAMKTKNERNLFIYYKSYRANIRAKVNSLRAKSTTTNEEKTQSLATVKKYLYLMENYLKELRTDK